jgi:hypothetical protein
MMDRMMDVMMMFPLQSLPRVIAKPRRRGSNSSTVNPTVAK